MRLGLGLVAALAIELMQGAPGHAQSQRYPPEKVDFDDESEAKSTLWQRVLEPDRDRYHGHLDRVEELLQSSRSEALEAARNHLSTATAMVPDHPRAYFLLGRLEERLENWSACADAYDQASMRDTGEQTTPGRAPQSGLSREIDLRAGRCHALAGSFERAIGHYKRALAPASGDRTTIYRQLGQSYMALGRLREAIASFTRILRLQSEQHVLTNYALAVAYDRDEKEARSRMHMARALRGDPRLSRLRSALPNLIPPAEYSYYRGLAHLHSTRGEIELAVAYFRKYLAESGSSPWRRRADQHLADLARVPRTERQIRMRGNGTLPQAKVLAAIATIELDLEACVASVPRLLVSVSLTAVGRPPRSRRGRRSRATGNAAPQLGVQSRIPGDFSEMYQDDLIADAQQCIESVAQKIDLPRPSGGAGRYVTVTFYVIAPGP